MKRTINGRKSNKNTRILLKYLIDNAVDGEVERSKEEIVMENDMEIIIVLKNLKILENAGYIIIYVNNITNSNFTNIKIKLLKRR